MHNIKAKLVGHETLVNNKIVFVFNIIDQKHIKTIKFRYSEFRDIHLQLEMAISKLKLHVILPDFPGRKIFGSTNKSEEAIFQRKKDLINYINELLSIQKILPLEIMKQYYLPIISQQADKINQEINIQICIDCYTLIGDNVHYYVRLRDLNSLQEWIFKARYSELCNLHESLLKCKIKNLPPFPKKKIFGITNQSPQDIEVRRQQLQKYFAQIFEIKEVINSEAIRFFIQESKKQAQKDKYLQKMRKKKKQV